MPSFIIWKTKAQGVIETLDRVTRFLASQCGFRRGAQSETRVWVWGRWEESVLFHSLQHLHWNPLLMFSFCKWFIAMRTPRKGFGTLLSKTISRLQIIIIYFHQSVLNFVVQLYMTHHDPVDHTVHGVFGAARQPSGYSISSRVRRTWVQTWPQTFDTY